MVGTDGYAPSTSRMSIEHSTIELSSRFEFYWFLYSINYKFLMSNFKLFIGPQTKNVLDAILTYDKFHPNKLGIIVSRDQVENKRFGDDLIIYI